MTRNLCELKKFEQRADLAIDKLSIWRQPIRSILSFIYLAADAQYVGARFSRRGSRNEGVGTAMITRMSYVFQFFGKCSREIGADIDDALSVIDEQFKSDIEQLLGYAHFCEIMPLVHRGFLSVERENSLFLLSHPDETFRIHEENDILMSEMVLPHGLAATPPPITDCRRILKLWPKIPSDGLARVLKQGYDHYINNVSELPLLSDEAFAEGMDFSRQDFISVRAALMAYANFCLGMADAAELLSRRAFTSPRRNMLEKEVREWAAPLLNRNHIIGMAAGVGGVEADTAERIIDLFTLDLNNLDGSGAGEGFFPPFLRFNDALLFSPHAVKRTMPERNLLYTMARTDTTRFDNVVSSHLEPVLLEETTRFLCALPGVEVRRNIRWRRGEIDILAYHAVSNSALQLQAKAGLPPQGARMLAQVESRTLEAANQLRRFLDLSNNERDTICSCALGRKVSGVLWNSGILTRTCLGTEKAWNRSAEFIPLNSVLLRAVAKKITGRGAFTFANLDSVVYEELTRLRTSAVRGWERKSFTLCGEKIELPLLDLDYAAIRTFRDDALS